MIDRVGTAVPDLQEKRVLKDGGAVGEPHREGVTLGAIRDVVIEAIRQRSHLRHTIRCSGERNDDLMLFLALGTLHVKALLLLGEEPKGECRVGLRLGRHRLIRIGERLSYRQTIVATDILHGIKAIDTLLHVSYPESADGVCPSDAVKRHTGENGVLKVGIYTHRDPLERVEVLCVIDATAELQGINNRSC